MRGNSARRKPIVRVLKSSYAEGHAYALTLTTARSSGAEHGGVTQRLTDLEGPNREDRENTMSTQRSMSGVEFPVAIPPGLVILLAGARYREAGEVTS